MRTLPKSGLVALAALVPLAVASTALSAQQEQPAEGMTPCTATVLPTEVNAGDAATRLSISLSAPIGAVKSFEAQDGAGLKTSAAEDLPRVPMANEGKEHKPIEMANDGSHLTLWLNTADAQPGAHDFTLVGSDGQCTGTVTVAAKGG